MANRPSLSLKSVGRGVVLGVPEHMATVPLSQRSADLADLADMSIQDMEGALRPKLLRRVPEQVRTSSGSQTARGLLEENRQLITEKQERRALARKNSQDEFERLVLQDRVTSEGDQARAMNRRHAQRELAQYYKEKIGAKEQEKAGEYSTKRESAVGTQYFPFVEGETIDKNRASKAAKMREEMQDFLQQQRDVRPPRADRLLADVKGGHLDYPVDPVPGRHRAASSTAAPTGGGAAGDAEASPHMARYPRFLSRAQEHMSRRLQDGHVRKALEDKVLRTKAELEAANRRREQEEQQWEEGIQVSDALRYDKDQAKAAERKHNAQFLQDQIQAKTSRAERDRQDKQTERAGYWGPEEKCPQPTEIHQEHCSDLIRQMEVDQHRRLNSRGQRLRQERRLIDNCMAEMSQDREKERQKAAQHREVLVTTWQSQQKIKQAMKNLDGP